MKINFIDYVAYVCLHALNFNKHRPNTSNKFDLSNFLQLYLNVKQLSWILYVFAYFVTQKFLKMMHRKCHRKSSNYHFKKIELMNMVMRCLNTTVFTSRLINSWALRCGYRHPEVPVDTRQSVINVHVTVAFFEQSCNRHNSTFPTVYQWYN